MSTQTPPEKMTMDATVAALQLHCRKLSQSCARHNVSMHKLLSSALSHLEGAQADKARLDWLLAFITQDGSAYDLDWTERGVIESPRGTMTDLAFDRAAIDSAMAAQTEG